MEEIAHFLALTGSLTPNSCKLIWISDAVVYVHV